MKIQLCSDLHLEFEPTWRPTNTGSSVLVLSGDIMVANYFERSEASPYFARAENFRHFIRHCSENWDDVIYVMGNHEHYHGRYDRTTEILRKELSQYKNIHLLDSASKEIDGVKFVGTTLWTNLNNDCPVTYSTLQSYMNDYKIVQIFDGHNYRKLNPYDTFKAHKKALEFIHQETEGHDRVVVCGHHAPSMLSVTERFKSQHYMNGGYCSDLSEFILDHPQIKLWTHGHVHSNNDYMIGDTRIACNPRGYNDENPDFDIGWILEVS